MATTGRPTSQEWPLDNRSKVEGSARIYDFRPIESMLGPDSNLATGLNEMSGVEREQLPSSIDLDSMVIGSPD